MKKKGYVIGGIVVLAVLVGLYVFTKSGSSTSDTADETKTVTFDGTWSIANDIVDEKGSLIDNQQLVFGDSDVVVKQDGKEVLTSAYSIDGDTLTLTDADRSYKISYKTDDVDSLYTDENNYKVIVKSDTLITDLADLEGTWSVTYHDGGLNDDEKVTFTDSTIEDTRGGSAYLTADCSFTDSVLSVPDAKLNAMVYKISDSKIVMVQEEGYVWVLEK